MTTSGSRNFTVSRAEIIQEAVANIGALDPGNTLSAEEEARANIRLNLMVKGWMARGANLWRREEVITVLQSGQQSYTFGTDHIVNESDLVETTLTVSVSSGATAIGIQYAGYAASTTCTVGVVTNDGSIHWSAASITEVVPGAFGATLTTALDDAATGGTRVYLYINKALNPLKVQFAWRRDEDDTDTTIRLISREEYSALSRKGSSGPVSCIHHDRQLVSRITAWPVVDTTCRKLHMVVDRVVEDFDTVADTPDYPVEWLNALMWGLSAELANVYGLPISERQWLKSNAISEFDAANTFDIEDSTVTFEYAAQ